MLVKYRRLPSDLLPAFTCPEAVATVFTDGLGDEIWRTFATNISNDSGGSFTETGGGKCLKDGLLLLVAKDRSTILRGLAYSGAAKLDTGDTGYVIYEGKYSGAATQKGFPNTTLGKLNKAGFYRTAAAVTNLKNTFSNKEWVTFRNTRHSRNERLLEGAGSYVCIGAKSAESGAYVGHGSRYISGGTKSYAEIAACLNSGRPVAAPGINTRVLSMHWMDRIKHYLNCGEADANAAVQDFLRKQM